MVIMKYIKYSMQGLMEIRQNDYSQELIAGINHPQEINDRGISFVLINCIIYNDHNTTLLITTIILTFKMKDTIMGEIPTINESDIESVTDDDEEYGDS